MDRSPPCLPTVAAREPGPPGKSPQRHQVRQAGPGDDRPWGSAFREEAAPLRRPLQHGRGRQALDVSGCGRRSRIGRRTSRRRSPPQRPYRVLRPGLRKRRLGDRRTALRRMGCLRSKRSRTGRSTTRSARELRSWRFATLNRPPSSRGRLSSAYPAWCGRRRSMLRTSAARTNLARVDRLVLFSQPLPRVSIQTK